MEKLRVFEAFAGYGSQSIALRNIGVPYEVVGISEIDVDAIISYAAIRGVDLNKDVKMMDKTLNKIENMRVGFDFKVGKSKIPRLSGIKKKQLANANEGIKNFGDISLIDVNDIPNIDLLTYSFPCTDISVAGKGEGLDKGSGTRSGLLWECERIIENKKPKYLLMENVKNLIGKKHKSNFDKWCEYLESLGYTNYYDVLNAKNFGIPQNRERVFMISILGEHELYEFPKGYKKYINLKDILEESVEDKYYLPKEMQDRFTKFSNDKRDNENLKATLTTPLNSYNLKSELVFDKCTSVSCYNLNKLISTLSVRDYKQPKQIIEIPQATKKGYIELEVPGIADLTYPNSKTRRGRVQENGKICPTLMANTQEICYFEECDTNDFKIRKLTPRECYRLMGLKNEDINKICASGISNAQMYKQAGNSIVINVLEAILKKLLME
ncbi:DNA (cytosine-5-)-methyltransferase [Paraclostridium sordellii]|uniref:DNA (cytosine-5-)-methyltransferase n=1 Tax=Paraclostridium sordellii TaxID=1505 RepID=UPI0022E0361A|nr:DNA (cytosine-5-)-methyltransferase [Paeniclostridium sordellii]